MSDTQKTLIPKWITRLILAALSVVENLFIPKIKVAEIQAALRLSAQPLKAMTQALSDGNPKDAEQVKDIWRKFVNEPLPDLADDQIAFALSRLKDENLRKVLEVLSHPTVNILRIVTDENPDDQTQIKDQFEDLIGSEYAQDVLILHLLKPILEKRLKDKVLLNIVLSTLDGALEGDGEGLN